MQILEQTDYNTNTSTPKKRNFSGVVTAIAAGHYHSLAIVNGALYSWGRNNYGQLGDSTITDRNSAVGVTYLYSNVKAVAAGWHHSIALKDDCTVWRWGDNGVGQLGVGTTALNYQKTPAQVTSLTGIVAIFAGGDSSMALKNDGALWAWGAITTANSGSGATLIPKFRGPRDGPNRNLWDLLLLYRDRCKFRLGKRKVK